MMLAMDSERRRPQGVGELQEVNTTKLSSLSFNLLWGRNFDASKKIEEVNNRNRKSQSQTNNKIVRVVQQRNVS